MEFVSFNKLLGEVASGQATSVDYDVIVSGVKKHCGFLLTEKDGTVNVQTQDKEPWIIIRKNGCVSVGANTIVLDRSNPELIEAIMEGADDAPFLNLYV